MKHFTSIICIFILGSYSIFAQDGDRARYDEIKAIEGLWIIDLRPSPGAEPYEKEMHITLHEDDTFTGEFYESDISESLINSNWNQIYFAFTTADKRNQYYHSMYLKEGVLYGTTYCPNRSILTPWTGKKLE